MSQSFDPFFNSISIPRASTSRSTTRLGAQFVNSFPRQLPQASSVPLPHFNPFRNSRFLTSRPLPSSNSLTSSEPLPDFDLFGNSLPLFRPLPVGPPVLQYYLSRKSRPSRTRRLYCQPAEWKLREWLTSCTRWKLSSWWERSIDNCSVCTDINGKRTHSNVWMIDALLGLITSNASQEDETADDVPEEPQHRRRDEAMISYAIRGQATLMSSWEDPHYFTGAFPTLFPTSESVVTRSRGLSLCHSRLLRSVL